MGVLWEVNSSSTSNGSSIPYTRGVNTLVSLKAVHNPITVPTSGIIILFQFKTRHFFTNSLTSFFPNPFGFIILATSTLLPPSTPPSAITSKIHRGFRKRHNSHSSQCRKSVDNPIRRVGVVRIIRDVAKAQARYQSQWRTVYAARVVDGPSRGESRIAGTAWTVIAKPVPSSVADAPMPTVCAVRSMRALSIFAAVVAVKNTNCLRSRMLNWYSPQCDSTVSILDSNGEMDV